MTAPFHGGRLREAAARTGIPLPEWLDLSTGINPNPWPVPDLPPEVWHRLPEDDDGLIEVARAWAGAPADAGCVAVPGSQAAIQLLPSLRPKGRVGVPARGYEEHAYRWRLAGHEVVPLQCDEVDAVLATLDVLVVIQPNNPTGVLLPLERLLAWHKSLAARGGWLVVDEAFMDPLSPDASMVGRAGSEGVIVLRSFGKFFGLAGVRAGLVFADKSVCRSLAVILGPWAVSGPARWVMKEALQDIDWQEKARERLIGSWQRMGNLLNCYGIERTGGTLLFSCFMASDAERISRSMESNKVLVRAFNVRNKLESGIRIGLPGQGEEWERLEEALKRSRV